MRMIDDYAARVAKEIAIEMKLKYQRMHLLFHHIISHVLPKSFTSDEEINKAAKQFGETKIDAVFLGAAHYLKFDVIQSIHCNKL